MPNGSTPSFVYTAQLLTSVERTVSRERLKRYLAATKNDMGRALRLYEANLALSETLYGVLHGVEITVRNAMHHDLTAGYKTEHWYDTAPLTPYLTIKVNEAKRRAGGSPASAGKVVAELSFGLWTDLAAHRNHWLFWVPHLHKSFPNAPVRRPIIHGRLEDIRRLRNRIAHHEPILTSQNTVYVGHGKYLALSQIDECVGWVCADTAAWLKARSRFDLAVSILARVHATGITF